MNTKNLYNSSLAKRQGKKGIGCELERGITNRLLEKYKPSRNLKLLKNKDQETNNKIAA